MSDLTLSELDRKILRLSDHMSPEQISREIGGVLSPAKCRLRIEVLLDSQDWLTLARQDAVVTWKLRTILGDLESRFADNDSLKIQVSILDKIGKRLSSRRAATVDDLNSYSANVGRQIGHVVDLALTYMKGALREEVDPERWDALVDEALDLAQQEIEKKQIETGE